MISIRYKNFIFQDSEKKIISVTGALHKAMISDMLSADECILTVLYNPAALGYYINDTQHGSGFLYTSKGEVYMVRTTNPADIDSNMAPFEGDFENAAPVDIYDDGVFFKRFYVTEALPIRIQQDGSVVLRLKAVSFIGLTVNMSHNGGIYTNSTVGAVIAEILQASKNTQESTESLYWYDMTNGLHYQMDAAVANTRADGHLKITGSSWTARDNIRDVCFAYGVSVLQLDDGSCYFTYSQPYEPEEVPDPETYEGQAYTRSQAVTAVRVIANTYQQYNDEEPVVLWEDTQIVSHRKVIFDDPCWGLYSSQDGGGSDTITIEESGANYAIISGTGTLYGIPYLHTQQEFSRTIRQGVENIKTADCGMVTLLNYSNMLDRMANYYGNAREITASIVVKNGVTSGSLISFNDPLGRAKNGYISEMNFTLSGIIKGDCKIVSNWLPSNVGNNFSKSQILTGSGRWTKAAAEAAVGHPLTIVRFDLIAGGDGGQPGSDGTAGAGMNGSAFDPSYVSGKGLGGAAGEGGLPGKVFSITLEGEDIPDYIDFACGLGGQPGSSGSATTATINGTTYSSDAGARAPAGYMDLLTGQIRAQKGPAGIKGGDGADDNKNTSSGVGEAVTYKGRTWTAGAYPGTDSTYRTEYTKNSSGQLVPTGRSIFVAAYGATSGGAAFGQSSLGNLPAGQLGTQTGYGVTSAISQAGGPGANALPIDDYTPELGSGGAGGNGGGGGGSSIMGEGSGGWRWDGTQRTYVTIPANNGARARGPGGHGSLGTAGGNGFITAYI